MYDQNQFKEIARVHVGGGEVVLLVDTSKERALNETVKKLNEEQKEREYYQSKTRNMQTVLQEIMKALGCNEGDMLQRVVNLVDSNKRMSMELEARDKS